MSPLFVVGGLKVSTRPCKKSDYAFAFGLVKETIFPLVAVYFSPSKEMFDERFARDYKERIILLHNNKRIGLYQLTPSKDFLDIKGLFLIAQYRKKGIGKVLMRYFESLHPKKLHLEVWDNNPAFVFYKKLGYNVVERKGHKFVMEKNVMSK
jgi:ribosomal protein S18 acetylase RimI-like enzyme